MDFVPKDLDTGKEEGKRKEGGRRSKREERDGRWTEERGSRVNNSVKCISYQFGASFTFVCLCYHTQPTYNSTQCMTQCTHGVFSLPPLPVFSLFFSLFSPPPSPDLLGEAQEQMFVVRVVEIPIHRKHQVAEQLKGGATFIGVNRLFIGALLL